MASLICDSSLDRYYEGPHIIITYSAISCVPMDLAWAVIGNSIYSDWDPIARARALTRRAERPMNVGLEMKPVHPGPDRSFLGLWHGEYTRPSDSHWHARRVYAAAYESHFRRDRFQVETTHTLERLPDASDTVLYRLEEHYWGSEVRKILCDRVWVSSTRGVRGWKATFEHAVQRMGEAIFERCEMLLRTDEYVMESLEAMAQEALEYRSWSSDSDSDADDSGRDEEDSVRGEDSEQEEVDSEPDVGDDDED